MKSNEETLNSNTNDEGDTSAAKPTICSLASLQVLIPDDIRDHLARQYQGTHCFDQDAGTILQSSYKRVDQILLAMKTPPSGTTCRVNLIHGSRQDIQKELEADIKKKGIDSHFEVKPHPEFSDVLCIDQKVKEGLDTSSRRDLTGPKTAPDATPVFPSWSSRSKIGWPIAHRAVLVDRFCGEAVLRGSHIFVRGILAADKGIQANEIVAVFADVHSNSAHLSGKEQAINRGLSLEQYKGRTCVYLGLGTSQYNRSDLFRLEKGVGVQMLLDAEMRVGPVLPPVHGILKSKIFFQNLPSMVVAHALAPQRGETIIDMCAAPGGKTSHIASLVQNNATIVACDVSRRKMLLVKAMVQEMGATCITPIALNTTDCVIKDQKREEGGALKQRTVKEVSLQLYGSRYGIDVAACFTSRTFVYSKTILYDGVGLGVFANVERTIKGLRFLSRVVRPGSIGSSV